jgi:hypothetical protein
VTTTTVAPAGRPYDPTLGDAARRSAQLAAGLTVAGAVTLATFFAVGEPWGTLNDLSAIALAASTVPIAVGLARRNPRSAALTLGLGLDVVGAITTSTYTALLITRRMTFEDSLLGVVGGQALIGAWLVLVGLAAWPDPASRRLAGFAITGGLGLVATAAGIATGGMQSPIAPVGFAAAIVGTLGAYALLGRRSVRGLRTAAIGIADLIA